MNTYHKDGTLPQNGEIFVFGSNLAGIHWGHGAGAAKVAREKFGAEWGVGAGFTGQCFAIPTKDEKVDNFRTLDIVEEMIAIFVRDTQRPENADKKWFVTRVGCGLAGYKDEQIAPMFKSAVNCSFAEEWREYLEL